MTENQSPEEERSRLNLPFELSDTGHQIVTLRYGDKRVRMILDTAAGVNVLSDQASGRLGVTVMKSDETVKGLGTSEHPVEKIQPIEVHFGESKLLLESLLSMDLSHVAKAGGSEGIDGLLGSPFFRTFQAIINFETNRISLLVNESSNPSI